MDYSDNKIIQTINGTEIINRDFEGKNVIFRLEIATCISEDFYRDGENSAMDYIFKFTMYLITKSDENYTFYVYHADNIETSDRRGYNKFDTFYNDQIKYSNCKSNYNITLTELETNLPKPNLIDWWDSNPAEMRENRWWPLYNAAKMSGDKELFFRMRTIAKKIWKQRKIKNYK